MTINDETGTCRECGARLLWVSTQNDKRIALDRDFAERRYVLESGTDPMVAKQRNTYSCHFDSCPKKKARTS